MSTNRRASATRAANNRLAHYLERAGVRPGQHVGMQLHSGIEYVAAILATLKIRAVPVNINYRYVVPELEYLYRDADLVALLYDAEFADRAAAAAPAAATLRVFIAVGEPGPSGPRGAVGYHNAMAGQRGARGFPARSPADVYIIYTGGTAGMPKGVMWHTEDLFFAFGGGNPGGEPVRSAAELVEKARTSGPVPMMPLAPLVHGAGQMATFVAFWMGGTVVLIRKFDPRDVLTTIARESVMTLSIVGDAMAVPLADEIAVGDYDLSSLAVVSSTGAILSGSVRDRLQSLLANTMIVDNFGSTESGYTAVGVAGATPETGLRYRPTDTSLTVLGSDLKPVRPGSGEVGQIARTGHISFGDYNDPGKTAQTYVTVDGRRWLLTGDIATVKPDGTLGVLGGSVCINTGGEKVFPEEVEATLKSHPAIFDVIVTGIPDPRYGERVAAVVQPRSGIPAPAADHLDRHCRARLVGYKVPRAYAFVLELKRSPAGKADYRWARETAMWAAPASGVAS